MWTGLGIGTLITVLRCNSFGIAADLDSKEAAESAKEACICSVQIASDCATWNGEVPNP
jgi:hypothetical protein